MSNFSNIESNERQASAALIINKEANNGKSESAIAPSKYLPPAYIPTTQKQTCTHCKDTSGRCGIGIPNKQHSLCYSVATREAAEEIGKQGIYHLIKFSDEHGYAEFYRKVADWKPFDPVSNSSILVDEIDILPEDYSITPLRDKKPYRENWQNETTVDRELIKSEIQDGHSGINKHGGEYTIYASGFGLRTGDPSNGILAIDVDGSSAQPVLEKHSGGELPETVSFTSGKKGRQQLLFQIPDEHRKLLTQFTKAVVNQTDDLKCNPGEQLEFRYNRMQSCLPPSRHPETGSYKWINSPEDIEIAIAPQWLLELLPKLVAKELEEKNKKEKKQKTKKQYDGSYAIGFDDVNSPYDARNLIQYCEGYRVKNNDWLEAKCPAHNGISTTSLTVRQDNGAFQCFNNCCNKDIYKSLIELAKINGVVFPDKKQDYQKTKEEYFVDYEAKRKKVARHHFTREPNILVSEGYFPDIKLKDLPQGLIGIKGDWGTGKSHLIASLIKQYPYNKVVQIGHLNSLLFNTSEKYGLTHHHLAKEQKWGLIGCDRLAITDISVGALLKTEIYLEQRYILTLDEIEQILNSLVNNKNLKGNLRMTYFRKLVWLIRNAEYLIFADADLSDSTLEFLEAIRNAEKVDVELEKTFIIHHTKKQGLGRKIKISKDKGATLKRLYESLADGQKTIAAFENKSDLLALQESTLNDEFRKSTDIIHGDNSQEEQVREYIKNIDSLYTESANLCYTGTLGTGIDLSKPHYEKRFGIFTGDVFAASDQCQQFSRYRPNCDSEIYCDIKKRNFKIDADQLVLELVNKNNESNTYFCDNISRLIEAGLYPNPDGSFNEYDQAFLKLWGVINARSNASRANPYQTLVDRLTEAGYELEFLDDSEDKTENDGVLASQKATKKELKEKEDIAKAEARILTDDEYIEAIRQKGNLDKQKQREVFKTRLAKTLGIPIDAGTIKLERTRKITTGLTLLHILLTDDESAIAFEMRDRKINPIITDRSHYLKKRELLKKLQIPEFLAYLNAGNNYSKSSDWAKAIAKIARANYKSMDSWLGIKIKFEKDKEGFKQSDTEIVGLILSKLGILTTNENKRVGGGWEREYEIDKSYWEIVFSTILPYMDSRRPCQDDYLDNQTSEIFDPPHPERYRIPKFTTSGSVAENLAT
ncbi:plasmid replication protein, CyRepA1 family [Nostoc sp. NMS4]|uniref:plasmid replication protein, CyRepA1 family n=1 Tax=Nostoc sp. NMS4 TaxID=2815390 RepID=UPI0025E16EBE|nr:plasmid replication protein, CyRepA1 family [Nostoc sp. NMS4]MBN3924624.1 bifunctional DNA primase/polymerase [Nostoc sp. NMS4]